VTCASLAGAGSAQASTVTLGSALTDPSLASVTFGNASTLVQTSLTGRTTVAPITGTVINWKVLGASGGPLKLQIVHPVGGGSFIAAGTSSPGTITGTGVLSFTSHLRINAGDLIGIQSTAGTDRIALTPSSPAGTNYDYWIPPLADGAAGRAPTSNSNPRELGLQATVATDCTVPDLKGTKLGAAQTAVTDAGCTNGIVNRPTKKRARKRAKFVVAQSVGAGSTVEGLTPVDLTLGKKPKKKKG